MKVSFITAAMSLLASSEAAIHKMKLNKIPLEEQLVRQLHVVLSVTRQLETPQR